MPAADSGAIDAQLATARDAFDRHDDDTAKLACEHLLAAHPDHAQALVLLTNIGIRRGDMDGAIKALRTLVAAPHDNPAWRRQLAVLLNNRGARWRESGQLKKALEDLQAAVRVDPDNADAWYNAALCLLDAGQEAQAASAVNQLLRRRPDDEPGRRLAARLLADRNPAACVEQLRLLRQPDSAPEALRLAERLDHRGDAAARDAYAEASRLAAEPIPPPLLRARLGQRLALPAVVANAAEIDRARSGFSDGLSKLESEWTDDFLSGVEPRLEQLTWCNFKLAYQGGDDRQLQSRFGDLLQRAVKQWYPGWCEPPSSHRAAARRIGLLSSSWRDCTVGHYFGSWIGWLREAGYDVHVYQLGPQRDAHTERLAASASRFHFHQGDLASLVDAVRSDQLDLLIYPELGMDARLLPLASLRLARVQGAAWGHPVTTGLPGMDVYFSCEAMEPADAPSHYRESLCLLPALGVDYEPEPVKQQTGRIADGPPSVLLPHSLYKLHPDNDAVIAELAALCPDAKFLLFRERYTSWNQIIESRLQSAFQSRGLESASRLVWHDAMPRRDYLQVNAGASLMLDALHWSGGNSSIDAITSGLPIVSSRGRFMRGRQSAAMLSQLALEDCITETAGLASRSAELLGDPAARRQIAERMDENRPTLFDSEAARTALVEHVARLIRE